MIDISQLIEKVKSLNKRERIILDYFARHISAGEIIAVLDLKEEIKKRVKMGEVDLVIELDDSVITRDIYIDLALLVKQGLLEYRNGVYKLPQPLIDIIKQKKKRATPGVLKSLNELLKILES
ncbi:MAG: hypothetical protein QXE81_04715 [Desulfurococcaceae archaeon]